MSITHHAWREIDVPVENLFFIDQLIASERAVHLLNYRLQGLWPAAQIAAGMQSPARLSAWANVVGFEADQVLKLTAIATLPSGRLFRSRLAACTSSEGTAWLRERLMEDFSDLSSPGDGGVVLATSGEALDQIAVCGYLLAVRLHAHPANVAIQQLQDEHITLAGDLAVVGGWLTAEPDPDRIQKERESEH